MKQNTTGEVDMQLAITYVSLFLAVFFTCRFILTVIGLATYSETNKNLDLLRGVKVRFRPSRPFLMAGICWCITLATI